MPEACGVGDGVGHGCVLSFLTRCPPASSGPWLRGVMACQGRNRRLVRDCPASIDAQMERKVQRVGGGDGGETRLGQASRVIARRFGAGADVSGAAWYGAERGCD